MKPNSILKGIYNSKYLQAELAKKGKLHLTDKEFKRLSRDQLIDIIYQLQLQIEELTGRTQKLQKALKDKRFRINNAGNIAEAALEINDCFRSAQNAADQYLNEIRAMHKDAEAECERMLAQAREEAAAIKANAKRNQGDYDSVVEAIMKEYGKPCTDSE